MKLLSQKVLNEFPGTQVGMLMDECGDGHIFLKVVIVRWDPVLADFERALTTRWLAFFKGNRFDVWNEISERIRSKKERETSTVERFRPSAVH